jgi:hypothetical protein
LNYRKIKKIDQTSKSIDLQKKGKQKRTKKYVNHINLNKIKKYKKALEEKNKGLKRKIVRYMIQKKLKAQVHKIHLSYITPNQRYYIITKMNKKKRICFKNVIKYTKQQIRLK